MDTTLQPIKYGTARQIRYDEREFFYTVARREEEVFVLMEAPKGTGGSTTLRWTALSPMQEFMAEWASHDHARTMFGKPPQNRDSTGFKPFLPPNDTLSGRFIAVLRAEGVLVPGRTRKNTDGTRTCVTSVLAKDYSFQQFLQDTLEASPLGDEIVVTVGDIWPTGFHVSEASYKNLAWLVG